MANNNNKLRLLKLYELLKIFTDENTSLSTVEIINILEKKYGIVADRRTIYDDIDTLIQNGYDIVKIKSNPNSYYLVSHEFDNAEIKCLMDLVEASQMLSREVSDNLKEKLSSLTSQSSACDISCNILENTRKTKNKKVLYSLDLINGAIIEEKPIKFLYYKFDFNRNKEYKNNKECYCVLPLAISIEDGKYYLIAIHNKTIKNFRIDKIDNLNFADNMTIEHNFKHKDLLKIKNNSFYMYSGECKLLELQINDCNICDILIDRFEDNCKFIKKDDRLIAQLNVMISPVLFAWLTCLGNKVKIISPKEQIDAFKDFLQTVSAIY